MMSDPNRGSNDELYQQIQRLEKEKEELERKNREKQLLEDKLRQLQGAVTSLRSGNSSPATPQGRLTGSNRASSPHGDVLLDQDHDEQARQDIQRIQSRHQSYSTSRTPPSATRAHKGREKEATSDSTSDEERENMMSDQHKHMIHANRDILVENMLSDDIFNDLISKKVFTTADVSRIKEKNTREAINEELLTVVCRRSDRAFHVFVHALRKTLQEYLADKIDPPSPSKSDRKKKRKRQIGEVNVRVDCDDAEPLSPRHSSNPVRNNLRTGSRRNVNMSWHDSEVTSACLCRQVEEEILRMAKEAYGNIRRRDATPMSFQQFQKESQQTNAIIKESMEIAQSLKMLCQHGNITGVSEGSIVFTVRCHSAASAIALWEAYVSGQLLRTFQKDFVTPSLRRKLRVRIVRLKVTIDERAMISCIHELAGENERLITDSPHYKLPSKKQKRAHEAENDASSVKLCKPSCPHCDPATRPSPRRAFQEILFNQSHSQNQTYKLLPQPPPSVITLPKSTILEKEGRQPLYNLRLRVAVTYR